MAELSRAGNRAKTNFFAKKQPLGGPTGSSGSSGNLYGNQSGSNYGNNNANTSPRSANQSFSAGLQANKPAPQPGAVPEWKRKQMEAEAENAKRREEEERIRREKLAQLGSSIDETPLAVQLGNTDHQDRREEEHLSRRLGGFTLQEETTTLPGPGVTYSSNSIERTSSSHFDPVDAEAAERAEEERLMRKTLNTGVGGVQPVNQPPPAKNLDRATSVQKCEVMWVDARSGNVVKQQGFPTLKGKLPIASIKRLWGVKSIVWADRDMELAAGSDGYSDQTFSNIGIVRVWCS